MNLNKNDLVQLAGIVKKLGAEVEVDPDELEAYYPEIDERSFYLPTNLPKGFYLGDTERLRSYNKPDSAVFRKLLGIR